MLQLITTFQRRIRCEEVLPQISQFFLLKHPHFLPERYDCLMSSDEGGAEN